MQFFRVFLGAADIFTWYYVGVLTNSGAVWFKFPLKLVLCSDGCCVLFIPTKQENEDENKIQFMGTVS